MYPFKIENLGEKELEYLESNPDLEFMYRRSIDTINKAYYQGLSYEKSEEYPIDEETFVAGLSKELGVSDDATIIEFWRTLIEAINKAYNSGTSVRLSLR